jgi:hypothetical protein
VHQSQEIEKWMRDDAKESRKLGAVLAIAQKIVRWIPMFHTSVEESQRRSSRVQIYSDGRVVVLFPIHLFMD